MDASVVTPEQERWAEALAVEHQHGDKAGDFINGRIRDLALVGDMEGAKRWNEIARRCDQLKEGKPQ